MRPALLALLFALPLAAQSPKPKVEFTTTLGKFVVELEPQAAPKTVANFLKYVRKGHYKGTTFHRVIPTFMIQGGGHLKDLSEKAAEAGIENEAALAKAAGLRNTRGTLAMARTQLPHSATAQFFINVKDNVNLDPPSFDNWGYCVFGHVVSGMETVDKIKGVKTGVKTSPAMGPMQDVPVTPVVILDAKELKAGDKAPAPKAPAKKKPAPKKAA